MSSHNSFIFRPRMVSIPTQRDLNEDRADNEIQILDKSVQKRLVEKEITEEMSEDADEEDSESEILVLEEDHQDRPENITKSTWKWLNSIPKYRQRIKETEDSSEGERKSPKVEGLTREYMLDRYTSEEDRIKQFILNEGVEVFSVSSRFQPKLRYSSQPEPVLTTKVIESMLEEANEKLDAKLRKVNTCPGIYQEHEYDYVCGTVAFPESWLETDKNSNGAVGLFQRIKNWLFYPFASQSKPNPKQNCQIGSSELLVIEPYKGPKLLNGAVITAGSEGEAFTGKLVDDVKTFLKAIHRAIYGDSPQRVNTAMAGTNCKKSGIAPPLTNEDVEIKRLTEMLQKAKKHKKKTHSRTVFALRNVDTIPVSVRRHRVRAAHIGLIRGGAVRPAQRESVLSRVVNRMIRRKPARRNALGGGSNSQRQRYRLISNRVIPVYSTQGGGVMSFVRQFASGPTPGRPAFDNSNPNLNGV